MYSVGARVHVFALRSRVGVTGCLGHPDPIRMHMNPNVSTAPVSSTPAIRRQMRTPDQQLAFRIRRRGDIIVLSARGEADAYTLPLWRQKVREAIEAARAARGALIVDGTRLDFLSLRTLAALAEDAAWCRRDGVEICLVTADPRLARLAGGDPRLAQLIVRSTVVGALTAFELHRRSTPAVVRLPRYRPPQITPEEPDFEHEVHLRLLAGGNDPGHADDLQPPVLPAPPRRGR